MLPKDPRGIACDPRITADPRKKPLRRVLVVDDVPEICSFYNALFRRMPSVHIVPTFELKVQGALARLRSEPFDLVITDMRLPDGSGDQVIQTARSSLPDCPIVLMTGYVQLSSREGLAASITKPLDPVKTLHVLSNILSPHAEAQEPAPVAEGSRAPTDGQTGRRIGGESGVK